MRHLASWICATSKKYGTVSHMVPLKFLCLGLSAIALLPGCQFSTRRDAGAAIGSGIGAVTGAMIGQDSGHFFGGALIGALAGGVTGGLIGNGEDLRAQRDAAITHAQYLEATGQVLTNVDVIRMVQYGLSDDIIIGTIKKSVGKYDVSPDGIIQLKAYGASDRVIITLQKVPKIPPLPGNAFESSRPVANVGVVVAPAPVMVYAPPRHHYYYGGVHPYR